MKNLMAENGDMQPLTDHVGSTQRVVMCCEECEHPLVYAQVNTVLQDFLPRDDFLHLMWCPSKTPWVCKFCVMLEETFDGQSTTDPAFVVCPACAPPAEPAHLARHVGLEGPCLVPLSNYLDQPGIDGTTHGDAGECGQTCPVVVAAELGLENDSSADSQEFAAAAGPNI